jgi:hypothetical protein
MVKINSVGVRDLGCMKDIDLKASIYPADAEAWAYAVVEGNCVNFGAYIGDKMVGFILTEQHENVLRILRLKVHPDFTCSLAYESLVSKAESLARDLHVKRLTIVIPEIHCMPGDPDDQSVDLNAIGFMAKGIVKDAFVMYGDTIDGFRFERDV